MFIFKISHNRLQSVRLYSDDDKGDALHHFSVTSFQLHTTHRIAPFLSSTKITPKQKKGKMEIASHRLERVLSHRVRFRPESLPLVEPETR
jgi:hypothetical protein